MLNLFSKLINPINNGPESAQLLATLLNVKISTTTLKKEIEEHPDYPSLLSISDVLGAHGIENLGIKFDPDTFSKTPLPFITQIKDSKSAVDIFTVVKSMDDIGVTFFDTHKQRWADIATKDFLEKCSGVALIAEANENAGEKRYAENRKEEKRKQLIQYLAIGFFPFVVTIVGITAFVQMGTNVLLPLFFSVLTLSGCIVALLLLWYEIDQYNPLLQQICSSGKKVNCDAILQSSASEIFGISWSIIGFTYFVGNLLLLLFLGIGNPVALFASAWMNALAAPYVLFSIYYQWQIAKQWCVLCLSVQALLVLQLITCLVGNWHSLLPFEAITIQLITQILSTFAVPFIAAFILLPALQNAKEGKNIFTRLQKLKHNREIFDVLMSKQSKLTENPEGLGIIIGDKEAKIKIIKVCNPYCGPCAGAHGPIHSLLNNNTDVQLQLIFMASNNEGDDRARVVNRFLSIAEEYDEKSLSQAIDDWYSADIKNFEVFASKYPVSDESKKHIAQIELMSNWCDNVGVLGTPTFFINDRELTNVYHIDDVKYLFSI